MRQRYAGAGGELIGTISLFKSGEPFDERDGQILKTFADQAAIAISNAKLFNDLDEALDQQRAMNDVLDAVSTARLDLEPVFATVARHANRLCGGTGAVVGVREGDELRVIATEWGGDEVDRDEDRRARAVGRRIRLGASTPTAQAARTGRVVHIPDWGDIDPERYPDILATRIAGRRALTIPMVRHGESVGVVSFARAGRYTEAEIALLQTFANQAAIAVDNARLLREIEQRNNDLAESLELQTATSDILALISANPGDLRTVLDGILARARDLVGAEFGTVFLRRGDIVRCEASLARGNLVGDERPFNNFFDPFADAMCIIENDYDPSTSLNAEWMAEAVERGVTRHIRAALRQDGG